MGGLGGLQARWVDVEIEVVVSPGERTRRKPVRLPQRSQQLARVSDAFWREQASEGVRHARNAQRGRGDRSRELRLLVDEQRRLPLARDRQQVGEHGHGADGTEQSRKHEVRPVGGRHHPDLREAPLELGVRDILAEAGGQGIKSLTSQRRAHILGGGPPHGVARLEKRPGERHHRIDMPAARRRREENTHAISPRSTGTPTCRSRGGRRADRKRSTCGESQDGTIDRRGPTTTGREAAGATDARRRRRLLRESELSRCAKSGTPFKRLGSVPELVIAVVRTVYGRAGGLVKAKHYGLRMDIPDVIVEFVRAVSAADHDAAAACVTEHAVFELPGPRRLPTGPDGARAFAAQHAESDGRKPNSQAGGRRAARRRPLAGLA